MKNLITNRITAAALFLLCCTTTTLAQEKKAQWTLGTAIGNEWKLGARVELPINDYLGWDIASVHYAVDYHNPSTTQELTITTGVRGYCPLPLPKDIKAYAGVNIGYGTIDWGSCHNFVTEVALGLKVSKHISVGYSLDLFHFSVGNHKDHCATVSYTF